MIGTFVASRGSTYHQRKRRKTWRVFERWVDRHYNAVVWAGHFAVFGFLAACCYYTA